MQKVGTSERQSGSQLTATTDNVEKPCKRCIINGLSRSAENGKEKALLLAIFYRHIECGKALIKMGADVNWAHPGKKDEDTLLLFAATWGYDDFLKLLLDAGADVNKTNTLGFTPIMIAVQCGHEKCIQLLIEAGADVNTVCKDGNTALMLAVKGAHSHCVDLLLKAGADVNYRGKGGSTLLMTAVHCANEQYAMPSVKQGANVNEMNKYVWNWITSKERMQCIDMLLQAGADVNATSSNQLTALMIAKNEDVVNLLLKSGANVNLQTRHGDTALMYAAKKGRGHIVKLLLKSGADVNHTNIWNETALLLTQDLGCMKLLLEAGSNMNTNSVFGHSALANAAERSLDKQMKLLLESGADVNAASCGYVNLVRTAMEERLYLKTYRRNPLITAWEKASVPCVRLLLQAQASINLQPLVPLIGRSHRYTRTVGDRKPCVDDLLFAAGQKFTGSVHTEIHGEKLTVEIHDFMLLQELSFDLTEEELVMLVYSEDVQADTAANVDDINPLLRMPLQMVLQELKLPLKHMCREAIRKHLLNLDPHENLFGRVPQLGLPSTLRRYLVYDVIL